jgi:hypothetical protein
MSHQLMPSQAFVSCDLTFDDIIDTMKLDDADVTITNDPTVNVPDIAKQ